MKTLKDFHNIHWLIVVLSFGLTFFAWYLTKQQTEEKINNIFKKEAEQVVELLSERMEKYEDALWSGVATIQAVGSDIRYDQWKTFASSLKLESKYPGINGIGVIYNIQKNNQEKFVKKIRKDLPDFKIHPLHDREDLWPITYIVPESLNKSAIGLDMAFEKNRYQATLRSKNSLTSQITGPIILVQDEHKTPGFLLFTPFNDNLRKNTGMVYAPFIMKKLMKGILDVTKRHVVIEIKDGETSLYNELDINEKDYDPNPVLKMKKQITMYGREWEFSIQTGKSFRSFVHDEKPSLILIGGIVIDILILLLIFSLRRNQKDAVLYANEMNKKLIVENQERKFAEQKALKLSKAKSEFLARMSHEIRTPMNGVLASANLLLENRNKKDEQLLQTIINSGGHLTGLINDILDLSKIESKGITLENNVVDINSLIEEVKDLFVVQAKQKNKTLFLNKDLHASRYIIADKLRLVQVISNLLSNAIKFAEDKIILEVTSKEVENQTGIEVQIKVIDDGKGIPHNKIEKIFDNFSQADESTTRKYGGTGLGLAIVKGIVELFNGDIKVYSVQDVQTSFLFTFMAAKSSQDEYEDFLEKDKEEKVCSDFVPEESVKILIVEDNKMNQLVLLKTLEKLGYNADISNNGLEAIQKLHEQTYDIIFMDQHMPVMDGVEATRKIIQEWGDIKPKIIALTASAMQEDKKRCLEAGMDFFLTKPIDINEIANTLRLCGKLEKQVS